MAAAGKWEHDLFFKVEGGQHVDLHDMAAWKERRHGRPGSELGARVLLENLHWKVNEEELKDLFSEFDLSSAKLRYDHTDRSTGVADLVFLSKADAEAAIKRYNGVELDEKVMSLRIMQEQTPHNTYRGTAPMTYAHDRHALRHNDGIVGQGDRMGPAFRDRRDNTAIVGGGRWERDRPWPRVMRNGRDYPPPARSREYESYRPMVDRLERRPPVNHRPVYDSYNGNGMRRGGGYNHRDLGHRDANFRPSRQEQHRDHRDSERSITDLDREMEDYMKS